MKTTKKKKKKKKIKNTSPIYIYIPTLPTYCPVIIMYQLNLVS